MPGSSKASVPEPLMFLWVILKVVSFLGIWLAIFLAMFMGYFTIPIIMIGILALVYAFADVGTAITNKRQRRQEELQHAMQITREAREQGKDF